MTLVWAYLCRITPTLIVRFCFQGEGGSYKPLDPPPPPLATGRSTNNVSSHSNSGRGPLS